MKKISEDGVRLLKAEAARRGVSPPKIVEEALDTWFKFSKNYIVENEAVDDLVWERNREKLSKKYYGKYVVIAGGRIVGVFEDLEELARTLRELKKSYRRIIVVRPGLDERVEGEWLRGSLEATNQ